MEKLDKHITHLILMFDNIQYEFSSSKKKLTFTFKKFESVYEKQTNKVKLSLKNLQLIGRYDVLKIIIKELNTCERKISRKLSQFQAPTDAETKSSNTDLEPGNFDRLFKMQLVYVRELIEFAEKLFPENPLPKEESISSSSDPSSNYWAILYQLFILTYS